jgi:hypothetical protein
MCTEQTSKKDEETEVQIPKGAVAGLHPHLNGWGWAAARPQLSMMRQPILCASPTNEEERPLVAYPSWAVAWRTRVLVRRPRRLRLVRTELGRARPDRNVWPKQRAHQNLRQTLTIAPPEDDQERQHDQKNAPGSPGAPCRSYMPRKI